MKSYLQKYFFEIFIIFIHLIFFAYQVNYQNFLLSDSKEYLWAAKNLVASNNLYAGDFAKPIDDFLWSKRPIVYPFFISLFLRFSSNILLVLLFQNIISIINILIIKSLLKKLIPQTPKALFIYLVISLLSIAQFIYANMLMAEIVFQFCIIIAVYFLYHFIQIKKQRHFVYFFIALCVGMLVKPVLFPVSIVFTVLGIIYSLKFKIYSLILSVLLPVVCYFSVCAFNESKTGVNQFSSIKELNLLYYNCYYYLVGTEGEEMADKKMVEIQQRIDNQSLYKDKINEMNNSALAIISNSPFNYAKYQIRGIVGFFIDPGRFDMSNFFNLNNEKEVGLLKHFNKNGVKGVIDFLKNKGFLMLSILFVQLLVKLTILIGIFLLFLKYKQISLNKIFFYLGLLIFIGGIAFLTGPSGASRFEVPVLPLVNLLAVIGFVKTNKRAS